MTIAAGFVCSDGLVLAADTLYTGENKRQGAKLWLIPHKDVWVTLAGAGSAVLIRRMRDEIKHELKRQSPDTERQIVQLIESVLYPLYVKHVKPDPFDASLDCLVGIRTVSDGCSLYESDKTALGRVDVSQCIGCGTSLGLYFADHFFESTMPLQWGRVVAAHLLQQTKMYARDCGGESHILEVPAVGEPTYVAPAVIEALEKDLTGFDKTLSSILIDAQALTPEDVERNRAKRAKWRAEREARERHDMSPATVTTPVSSQSLPSSIHAPKDQLPSPESPEGSDGS
jgi:20S proteasome alpha/beta subunit